MRHPVLCIESNVLLVQCRKDSTHIEADIFLQRSFWLRNLSVSPAAAPCLVSSGPGGPPGITKRDAKRLSEASLLIALAPPGLNFTKFWISDVKAREMASGCDVAFGCLFQVSWNNLMALDSSPIVVEIELWPQPFSA